MYSYFALLSFVFLEAEVGGRSLCCLLLLPVVLGLWQEHEEFGIEQYLPLWGGT